MIKIKLIDLEQNGWIVKILLKPSGSIVIIYLERVDYESECQRDWLKRKNIIWNCWSWSKKLIFGWRTNLTQTCLAAREDFLLLRREKSCDIIQWRHESHFLPKIPQNLDFAWFRTNFLLPELMNCYLNWYEDAWCMWSCNWKI